MSTWEPLAWGDVSDLRYGKALRGYKDCDGSTQVFGTNGPIGYTSEEPLAKGPRPVVGRKGAYRGVHLAAGPFWVIDTAYWLEPKEGLDPVFAYYALLGVDINGMDSGSALPSLTREHFYRVPLDVPPLEEQKRIAGVLGAFDDLIETNREIVRRIDRLGRTVVEPFTSAKHEESATTLAQACDVIESGRRPKGGVKGIIAGVPSLGAEFINGLAEFAFAKTKFVPTDFADHMRRGVLTDLDVLVYKDGGKPGEFFPDVSVVGNGYPFERMVINEHVFRLRGSETLGQGYLYFWLSTEKMMGLMKEAGSRTAAIPGMNSTNFGQLPVAVPDLSWRSAHMHALDSLIATALALLAENRDLAHQRDELLPLLMSGKVRVREANDS